MKKWTLEQIANWTKGQILSTHQTSFDKVGTDTRADLEGQVFFALNGDNFNAHQFLKQAAQKKAGVLVVSEKTADLEEVKKLVSVILVSDTLQALQDMAHEYRKTLKAKVVGITGSNGKTSTKEFLKYLIQDDFKTHSNKGSFNNHWGVPLTLLGAGQDTEVIISEMGMNHSGEIKRLVEIAQPDVVVCTMVGRAHIEHFGTEKKIAEAKSEIYMYSNENTIRVFNQDQDLTFDMMYPVAKKYPASRMLSFSEKNKDADVFFKLEKFDSSGLLFGGQIASIWGSAQVPVFGKHNITNLMAASLLAYALGLSPEKIWKQLPKCQSEWGRNEFIKTQKEVDVLFDGYNANPESMGALIENLKSFEISGRKIIALGQMKELGTHAQNEHFNLGALVARQKFDAVFFAGENAADFKKGLESEGYKSFYVDNDLTEGLKQQFIEVLRPKDFLAVKGSRGAQTERYVELCSPIGWKTKS